jgi:hypothetical protein
MSEGSPPPVSWVSSVRDLFSLRLKSSGPEAACDRDLAKEPLSPEGSGEIRPKDLDRDPALQGQVRGKVDRGHPTAPELLLQEREPRVELGKEPPWP